MRRTSARSATAVPPARPMASQTCAAPRSFWWYVTATRAPKSASTAAVAAPIPEDAPVTSATFPLISR